MKTYAYLGFNPPLHGQQSPDVVRFLLIQLSMFAGYAVMETKT
jgi:hypothetical protein